jgi:hypothetical protein
MKSMGSVKLIFQKLNGGFWHIGDAQLMKHATAEFNPATITDRQTRRSPPLTATGLQLSKIQCKPHSESSAVVCLGKISLAEYVGDGQRSKPHSG